MATTFETIEKENILSLRFPNNDVLQDKDAIFQRNSDLNRAQSLGNLEHSKIKIFFEDSQSKKVVETTVWAVTDNQVVLKQGIGIPINRIFKSI
jgi:Flp pilus assembly CpaE family ATPase